MSVTPRALAPWLSAAGVFVILDLLWLGLIANRLYFDQLGYLAETDNGGIVFNLPVGLLTQVVIGLGLYGLSRLAQQARVPALPLPLITAGGGFVIYLTYDFTNLSFIKDWPVLITVIDIGWGTLQGALAGWYGPRLTSWWRQH